MHGHNWQKEKEKLHLEGLKRQSTKCCTLGNKGKSCVPGLADQSTNIFCRNIPEIIRLTIRTRAHPTRSTTGQALKNVFK